MALWVKGIQKPMDIAAAKSVRAARRLRDQAAGDRIAEDETIVYGISCANSFGLKEAKDRFENLLNKAQATPVAVTKQDRPVVVVLSVQEYESLQRLDDAYWAARADKAFAKGDWLSVEESEKFLRQILDAPASP